MQELGRLLVGVDFHPRSQTAAEMAVTLGRKTEACVDLIYVIENAPTETDALVMGLDRDTIERVEADEAQAALDTLEKRLDYEKIRTEVASGSAAGVLTQRYNENDADLLLIGNSGSQSPMPRHGLGVTAYRLVERGPDRVLVVKPGYHGALDRIAAAIDYSAISGEVIRLGVSIAMLTGARLFAVHAVSTAMADSIRIAWGDGPANEAMERLRNDCEKRLNDVVQAYRGGGVQIHTMVLAGSVSSVLLTYLREEQIDLVVLGTGTTPRLAGYPIGSTTHSIVNETSASVLVVRAKE